MIYNNDEELVFLFYTFINFWILLSIQKGWSPKLPEIIWRVHGSNNRPKIIIQKLHKNGIYFGSSKKLNNRSGGNSLRNILPPLFWFTISKYFRHIILRAWLYYLRSHWCIYTMIPRKARLFGNEITWQHLGLDVARMNERRHGFGWTSLGRVGVLGCVSMLWFGAATFLHRTLFS